MSPTPSQITKTFKEQVEDLIHRGIAANQQEIVNELGWHKAGMSQAMNLSKNVPVAVYRKFTERYKLAAPGIVNEPEAPYGAANGSQDYREEVVALLRDKVKNLEAQLNSANGELRHIAVMNHALLKALRGAVAEMLAKQGKNDLPSVVRKLNTMTASYYSKIREKGSLVDLDS